jgi:hypothetical protein
MQSHTVPRALLEQFAFDDAKTRSPRLWCYKKGISPHLVSPKSATRWEGHFSDPDDPKKEVTLEAQLKREIEDPVNQFIKLVGFRTFTFNATYARQLTAYIRLLFHRSRARRAASEIQSSNRLDALRSLLADEDKLSQIAGRLTLRMLAEGSQISRAVTANDLKESMENEIAKHTSAEESQRTYIQTLATMLNYDEPNMYLGQWGVLRTEPQQPFVIGDAPVVSWIRTEDNALSLGQGFAKPEVEILLPVSPTACLHVLPRVDRSRVVKPPTVDEVNGTQAAFATQSCFTNLRSDEIDSLIQPRLGVIRLGREGFSTRHIDYKQVLFDILMGRSPLKAR